MTARAHSSSCGVSMIDSTRVNTKTGRWRHSFSRRVQSTAVCVVCQRVRRASANLPPAVPTMRLILLRSAPVLSRSGCAVPLHGHCTLRAAAARRQLGSAGLPRRDCRSRCLGASGWRSRDVILDRRMGERRRSPRPPPVEDATSTAATVTSRGNCSRRAGPRRGAR